jgi:hypothetical protein
MNRMIAFILLLAIASVRDIAAESNLRAADNSSSLVSHSQRRELSWWGSFFNAFLLHPPSGSGSSSSGSSSSGSSSSSSSSSSSGSSTTADGAYDDNSTADAAASDGGWDGTHEDIDYGEGEEWQYQYAKGDTGGSSAGGSSGGAASSSLMYIVVAMIGTVIGAAMVTAWVREIIGTCIIIAPRSIFRTS